jgi:drug/metabolite transporter (DMT)-like permease
MGDFLNKNIDYMSLMLAQLMVGINIVGSKYLLQYFPIIFIVLMRFSMASVFLLIMHWFIPSKSKVKLRDLNRRDWTYITVQAVCAGVLFNLLLMLGLNYTEASVAGIITSALPAIIAILSVLFLKERLTMFSILCIGFAILGLLIMNINNFSQSDMNNIIGDLIILLSLIPEATYYLLAKIYVSKLPLFLIATLMNAINVPFLIIAYALIHQGEFHFSPFNLFILVSVGLASGFFYVFWFWGCKNIKGSVAGLFTAFMPVMTLLIAWICLGETISLVQFCGMLLVMLSVIFNAKREREFNA